MSGPAFVCPPVVSPTGRESTDAPLPVLPFHRSRWIAVGDVADHARAQLQRQRARDVFDGLVRMHANEWAKCARYARVGHPSPEQLRDVCRDLDAINSPHSLGYTVELISARVDALHLQTCPHGNVESECAGCDGRG